MKKVFFDTSAVYTYINRGDPDHARVKKAVKKVRGKLVITNYVFDEIITLVQARLGHNMAVSVGETLMHAPDIERIFVNEKDESEAWKLFTGREDKKYSFTDCTSFVIMKRLNISSAITLDVHFKREGFTIL